MARSDEGKIMGMHAGSNGDLRSNIPWSFGCFVLGTCSSHVLEPSSNPAYADILLPLWLCSSTRCWSFVALLL
ncbi:hypothetical protein Pyn_37412 [Prunus yedoensis var. nudiflora]|uniref:Uncharacterized protein n=1 Tax=Prunus yedoensis var. nudiflora TaxID=2094558 RepID=A0A314UB55_PRUYE|nr:hypothetical protein Pyn_37412 [Prunus yedoensis var. nudiflora]